MAKYKVLFNDELEDEVFDTEEEAVVGNASSLCKM